MKDSCLGYHRTSTSSGSSVSSASSSSLSASVPEPSPASSLSRGGGAGVWAALSFWRTGSACSGRTLSFPATLVDRLAPRALDSAGVLAAASGCGFGPDWLADMSWQQGAEVMWMWTEREQCSRTVADGEKAEARCVPTSRL